MPTLDDALIVSAIGVIAVVFVVAILVWAFPRAAKDDNDDDPYDHPFGDQ